LPGPRTQRYLVWLGVLGTLTSCFGCSLAAANQMNAARAFLVLAWLVLVPLFFYLLILRNRASAEQKRRLRKRAAQEQKELAALAAVDDILAAGKEPPPGAGEPQG
jgi:uncharacterized protein (DUF58 family)